jgi:hypothetical protein
MAGFLVNRPFQMAVFRADGVVSGQHETARPLL